MKVLRWLAIGLGILVLVPVVVAAARLSDGPIGPFAGGALHAGTLVDERDADWSFARGLDTLEFQPATSASNSSSTPKGALGPFWPQRTLEDHTYKPEPRIRPGFPAPSFTTVMLESSPTCPRRCSLIDFRTRGFTGTPDARDGTPPVESRAVRFQVPDDAFAELMNAECESLDLQTASELASDLAALDRLPDHAIDAGGSAAEAGPGWGFHGAGGAPDSGAESRPCEPGTTGVPARGRLLYWQ